MVDGNEFKNINSNGLPNRISFGGWSFSHHPIFEDSDLTYWFSEASYRVLSQEELLEPLTFEVTSKVGAKNKQTKIVTLKNTHALRPSDIEDLYHFHSRVRTVADAIFGFFD